MHWNCGTERLQSVKTPSDIFQFSLPGVNARTGKVYASVKDYETNFLFLSPNLVRTLVAAQIKAFNDFDNAREGGGAR